MRRILLTLSLLLLPLALVANADRDDDSDSATNEVGIDRRCEAKIDRTAGSYARCLLKAKARAARDQEQDVEETREAEAECREDFDEAVDRALARHQEENCTPFVTQIEDRTASYAASVATEASGVPDFSFLFVQSATGGTLTESTLTLTGVGHETGVFSERPARVAGQMSTEDFASAWGEGSSFAEDPPNADVACEIDGEPVDTVVELTDPIFDGVNLSYRVNSVGDEGLPAELECDSAAYLFIDGYSSECPVGLLTCPWNDCCCPGGCAPSGPSCNEVVGDKIYCGPGCDGCCTGGRIDADYCGGCDVGGPC